MLGLIQSYLMGTAIRGAQGEIVERVSKGLINSKTTCGALIAVVAWLLQHFNIGVDANGAETLVGQGIVIVQAVGAMLSVFGIRSAVGPMGPRVVMPVEQPKRKRGKKRTAAPAGNIGLNGVAATVVSQRKPRATKAEMAARKAALEAGQSTGSFAGGLGNASKTATLDSQAV